MLSRQKQYWAIRVLLEGEEWRFDAQQIDDPFLRSCLQRIRDLPARERKAALQEYLVDTYANWQDLYRALVNAPPPPENAFTSYAELAGSLPPIRWFWPGWIPNRLLSALVAPPGVGKSLVALDLARRVIEGEPAPDETPLDAHSHKVIYVEAENVPQITVERARRWQVALDQLYPLLPPPYGIIDLNQTREQDRLVEMTNALRPGLIVVDSLSMISNRGEDSVEEVRPILAFLAALAGNADCAVLLLHHTRKRVQGIPVGQPMNMDDLRGSSHITAACRSILGLSLMRESARPDLNGARRLEVLKTNLGPYPAPLGVQFQSLEADGVLVCYQDISESGAAPAGATRCAEWLLQLLQEAGGPLRPQDVVREAESAGFARRTIYRARNQLGSRIANTLGYKHPDNCWQLAGQDE